MKASKYFKWSWVPGVFAFITGFTLEAQDFQGIATYKTASSFKIEMEDTEMSGIDQEAMQKQLSKAMQREYELRFNLHESNYKQVESLGEGPAVQSGGVMVKIAGGDNIIYRNTRERKVIEGADLFGKPFIVDDEARTLDWEIGNETKQIGKYECRKATFKREIRRMEIDSTEDEPKEVIDTVEVSAWFTPEISVNHGPADYWGLPGLVLEVNDGSTTIICTKVVLNPSEKVKIEIPDGGKVVSREEFEELRDEKTREMMNQYQGTGTRQVIRIRN